MTSECNCCDHSYTPHFRSTWARAVYNKIQNDRCLEDIDHRIWYKLENNNLLLENIRPLFIQFNEDNDTKEFLQKSYEKSEWLLTQLFHSVVTSLLTLFLTRTSTNGLLGRGSMFVYSTEQFSSLLDIISNSETKKFQSLLDIGASDGTVTSQMEPLFNQIYVTEMSSTMQWRLKQRGYTVLDTDNWQDLKFDVITLLNVLDRCEKPLTLLKNIREHLNETNGRLIVSIVLLFQQYFEYKNDHRPSEQLIIDGNTPEEQINSFILNVFQPSGFKCIKVTKLPYLCEGDLERSYYYLPDYIFVLEIDK
ncbi:unnamed protein product [Didymodactylos carnosus]|uniref:Methyltransferase-like protein 9 n=1 Tax=Didymodactylos carnosus TaxID=1234261 RepID=A0A813T4Z2_9BILA|nr:unnamed protein product [Didymodactylos carnosus]CAF0806386.1 unnamed protein product [Didymodactylos carnosus]CAF3549767.1 unnamed protein product [Didymodactylos carnosus]CAF3591816.1 unnamed protein product [Didymodactylos carnosus]